MDPSRKESRNGWTRRSVLQLPFLCWLTSILQGNAFAKRFATGPIVDGILAPRTTSLNGTWSLTYGPLSAYPEKSPGSKPPADWPTIPATVPGNVELDMVAAGKLEPLETGSRVYQGLQLENHQWWYTRTFMAGHGEPGDKAELVFEGLDCVATVWLNGKEVGKAANMLVEQRFDVTAVLRPGEKNEIVVRIDPAVLVGLSYPHTGWELPTNNGHWESLYVRKAAHMYGWDIMPRIVSAGLWKDVYVEWIRPVRISSVYWHTKSVDVQQGKASVCVAWKIDGVTESDPHRLEVVFRRDGATVAHWSTDVTTPSGEHPFDLNQVQFWWPRGYGEQPLYQATVSLVNSQGKVVDRNINRIGIRTIELDRTDILIDGKGKFGFTVNGVPVFARGTNYSCLDGLHSRDHLHLDRTVQLMAEANCNMARCWGGNVYPETRFFDMCDEAGIMVWQDFNMACAVYPNTPEFLDAIHAEAHKIVPRFRNHPSLALWSGNNECDDAFEWAVRDGRPSIDPNLDVSTRKTIPAVLRELDPNRAYLPSSPYHSPAVFAAGNQADLMPEVHLWGPRGYFKDPFYVASPAHFASEIGYHGCPSRSSLERMMDPDSVEPWVTGHQWNQEWLTKSCRSAPNDKSTLGRNDLMIHQVQAFFGTCPSDLDDFILASQITQAEAMKFFVELFRQNRGYDAEKGQKQGIIWWNIRDGWPIISDAVVDYYFNKKLAYGYLQRVQRDVQAICCEPADGEHAVVLVNDTLKTARGHLQINRAGETATLLSAAFNVEPNGKAALGSLPHPATNEMWQLQWMTEGIGLQTSHYLAFTPTVDFQEYKAWLKIPGLLPV